MKKGLDLAEIASQLHISGVFEGRVLGFQQDSRLVKPGDLFFALPGEKVDGHSFLKQAASQGASCAVVSSLYQGEHFGLQLFPVENVLIALQSLARYVHKRRSSFVIGVTGSVGKTTTKEFITTILSGKFSVAKTPGNSNSQVGLPLAILNLEEGYEILIVEMGMSAPGNIAKLVSIIPPDLAIITQIALAHVVYFEEGIEGIAKAKGEILSHPQTKMAVLQKEAHSFASILQSSCEKTSYGDWSSDCDHKWRFVNGQVEIQSIRKMTEESDLGLSQSLGDERSHLACIAYTGDDTIDPFARAFASVQNRFFSHFRYNPESYFFTPPFTAPHLIENAVGAILIALACGMSFEEIVPRLSLLHLPAKRFEAVDKEGILFINDSYNANPTSMKAAIGSLPAPSHKKKRIGVLGAMKELGIYEEESHRSVGEFAASHLDYLLCFGKECEPLLSTFQKQGKQGEYFSDLSLLKKRVFEIAEEGDVVLLKGSNSNQLWKILDP